MNEWGPTIDQSVETLQSVEPALEARYQVEELAVFGSVVNGKTTLSSYLDIPVKFREPPSMLQFIHLENEFSGRLAVKLYLVTREAAKPPTGKRTMEEMVPA
jgi:predicted nucleotidyltransferase